MSGYLHVFMTGSRVTSESAEQGDYADDGYVDPKWSWREFQDRNNAGTVLSVPLSDPDMPEQVRDAVERYLGAYTDNGDGTLYGTDEHTDYATGDSYTYALHFVRKYLSPYDGYQEEAWTHVSNILAGQES